MARKQKQKTESVAEKNEIAIWEARRIIDRTPLCALLDRVQVLKLEGVPGDPALAAVDPPEKIWLNPYGRKPTSASSWAQVICHMLLPLALNHAARREERDP